MSLSFFFYTMARNNSIQGFCEGCEKKKFKVSHGTMYIVDFQ